MECSVIAVLGSHQKVLNRVVQHFRRRTVNVVCFCYYVTAALKKQAVHFVEYEYEGLTIGAIVFFFALVHSSARH